MRRFTILCLPLLAMAICTLSASAREPGHRHTDRAFIDTSAPDDFIELRAYALGGGSTITQNYISCFPQINQLNVSMGPALGAGASAQFALRDYIAIGTEFNLLINNYSTEMVVTSENVSSVSTIFLDYRYYTVNIPVFASMRFNIARRVKWNVDLGLYYSYGLGGRNDQTIYDARINEIGQLVTRVDRDRVDYYNDRRSFICSSGRGDLGLHLGTGLTFGNHFLLGARMQLGFYNVAKTDGLTRPNIHNFAITVQAGYKF